MHMITWVPLVTTLSSDDFIFEDFGITPLLDTKTTTGTVFFVVGATRHHLRGETSV